MSTQAEVDATVVGCMIDAFMVIVAERNRFHLPLDVTDRKENQSTAQKEVIDLILSGEVSKNYLQEVSKK